MAISRRKMRACRTRRQLPNCCATLLAMTVAMLFAGCGGANISRPTGQIVERGVPVERAEIVFSGTTDDREMQFTGITDGEGRYQLDYGVHDGLPAGPTYVTISRALLRDGSPVPPGEEGMHMVHTGAARLRTYEYDIEVPPGAPQLDFDLADGDDGLPR